jgi:hypothetical protein
MKAMPFLTATAAACCPVAPIEKNNFNEILKCVSESTAK